MAPRNTIRCPWCTARVAEGARCAACGCEPVDASDYGVARMLRAAGVDRIALPERARAVDGITRARLQDDWRAQRELVDALHADAALAAETLPTGERLLADVDDELARMFPVAPADVGLLLWPARPGASDRDAALETARTTHPVRGIRSLAVLASAWRGDWRREVVFELRGLVSAAGVVGATAAAALCGWRARHDGVYPPRRDEQLERALAEGLAIPELGPWAAVALALLHDEAGLRHRERLQAVSGDASPELRLGAALALDEEHLLAAFIDDPDPARRAAARRALAALGAASLVPLLSPAEDQPLPPDEVRSALLRALPEPLPAVLRAAVMACFERGGDQLASQAVQVLRRGRFADRDADGRAALAAFVTNNAARLGAERALELLAWARDSEVAPGELSPFVKAARAALALAPLPARIEARELDAFLISAGEDELRVLDPLLDDGEQGARLLGRALDLYARREQHGLPDAWIERRCACWWTGRPTCVEAWSSALSSRSGMSGRDDVLAFFWRRFCAEPEQRCAIAAALRPWSQLLHELRDAASPGERPGGDDVVAVWDIWSAAEPHDMWRLVDQLGPTVPDVRLAAFTERVFDAAERVVAQRPRTGIVTVFRVCAEVANRVRREPPSEALDAAAAELERRAAPFAARFGAAPATEDGERGAEHFLDDIATERRLIAEVYQGRSERAPRDQARERERAAAVPIEPPARVEPTAAPAPVAPPNTLPPITLAQPMFAPTSFDDEPFVAGPGPRTLLQYAQLLKALQAGQDALAVFAAFGLDPVSWAACANGWGALMTRRSDVALRFAALLSEQWR